MPNAVAFAASKWGLGENRSQKAGPYTRNALTQTPIEPTRRNCSLQNNELLSAATHFYSTHPQGIASQSPKYAQFHPVCCSWTPQSTSVPQLCSLQPFRGAFCSYTEMGSVWWIQQIIATLCLVGNRYRCIVHYLKTLSTSNSCRWREELCLLA